MKNRIYYFLTNLSTNIFKLISHLFWLLWVHDIESFLVTDAFPNDLLCYTYCHSIFFFFFYLYHGIFALEKRFYRHEIPHVFLDQQEFNEIWLYQPIGKSGSFFLLAQLLSKLDSSSAIVIELGMVIAGVLNLQSFSEFGVCKKIFAVCKACEGC